MRYFRTAILLVFGMLVSAHAESLPEVSGYSPVTLTHNLPLTVLVDGQTESEQDVQVVVYMPTEAAAPVPNAVAAKSVPGLPTISNGYRLVVLPHTYFTSLSLRDGRVRTAVIPLFAYEPIGADAAPEQLEKSLDLRGGTPSVPAPEATKPSLDVTPFELAVKAASVAALLKATEPVTDTRAPDAADMPKVQPEPAPREVVWDDVLAETGASKDPEALANQFRNGISVGDIIVDERQLLRNRMPVPVQFFQKPLSEVVLALADAAGLDYSLGAMPGDPLVTTRFRASPFAGLEQIARQYGLGLYREPEDAMWVIRSIDSETLIARTHQLHHLHLGANSGATGLQSFGSGMESASTGQTSSSSSSTRTSSSSSQTGSAASAAGVGLNGTSDPAVFRERFSGPSDVLLTIKGILGLVDQAPLVSDLNGDEPGKRIATRPEPTGDKVNGIVSYRAESNSIFVVGTERQQQWVAEYLRLVDRPPVVIAIDSLFVESDDNPAQKVGVDWSETATDWRIGTPELEWGTLSRPELPSGAILSSNALSAKLNAYITESRSRVARYPRVVTSNNREVRIATTSNIPIITSASTVVGAVSATPVDGGTGTIQTNYSSGTQEIGTIITLQPSRVNDDLIHIKIAIEISSGESRASGEELTGRIPTTSTTYEGEFDVPAGKTLAIGGLERIADNSGIQRVPMASKIPLFGFLFKKKDTDFRNTNITLFVTPRIIDVATLPEGTKRGSDGIDRALKNTEYLEDRANRQASSLEQK